MNFVIAAIISSFWFFGIIGLVIYSTSFNRLTISISTKFKLIFLLVALLISNKSSIRLFNRGIIGLVIYSIVLFFILRKYYIDLQKKYQVLLKATNEIAEGNLDVVITAPNTMSQKSMTKSQYLS